MRASEFIVEAYDQSVIRMGRLSKDGRVVRILKHQDTVGFSPDPGWLLIDITPGRRHPENIKWIPDTTQFDWVREFNSAEELLEISDDRLQDYLSRASRQVDARQERMARVRDRLNKGYEIYHAETPNKIVHKFEADTPALAQRYYADYVDRYESDVDYDLRLRRATGIMESINNTMSTAEIIDYIRQLHPWNLPSDYLNHLTTTNSKFVLKNIPLTSIRTELAGLDREKVEQYKQMDFSKAPPIVVGSDGNILDGYHRANVAKALGMPSIRAYVGVKEVDENFADGKVQGKSRPGRVKRAGASCAGSVTDLRAKAKKYGGERGKMYHWCANMKGGKKK